MNEASAADLVALREARATDLAFIVDSWLKSNRRAPPHQTLGETAYFQGYKPLVISLLHLPSTRAVIACNPEDDDQIVGYAVWTPGEVTTLHYVYVKDMLRKRGIARAMVEKFAPEVAQKGAAITALGKSIGPDVRFGDLVNRFKLSYEPYRLWRLLLAGKAAA